MENVVLGRTGLSVGAAGLGGGGRSRLGLGTDDSKATARAVIQRALELGVTYFDTAASYGTEDIYGEVLAPHRDVVVLSSKVAPRIKGAGLISAADLCAAVDSSLKSLRSDYIDVFHLHRVRPADYDHCTSELVPELERIRDSGKIRFLAISESSGGDPDHSMLAAALEDDVWDVVMLFFSVFNQSARETVLKTAMQNNVGVEVMSAANGPMSRPDELCEVVDAFIGNELLVGSREELVRILHAFPESAQHSLVDMAYRYARHEPGCHVVLSGTSNPAHLRSNVDAICSGPLSEETRATIVSMFQHLRYPVGSTL